jgi:ubiquinone/menaquinone biosynthesis C-methylase UbiE
MTTVEVEEERGVTDLVALKEHQQETWAAGDFSMFARTIVIVSERLCEAAQLRADHKVLDVACGSGNTAIAAARRGCDVVGIDYVPALLERAKERAAAERFTITFLEGDAEDLDFPDETFDVVMSTFGVMFAPDQEKAAAELLRVCKPGGKIAMSNFPPNSLAGGFLRAAARYQLPPRGVKPPVLWGNEDWLNDTFGHAASKIEVTRQDVKLCYKTPEDWLDFFTRYFGPIGTVYEALNDSKRERFGRDLMEVVIDGNVSGDDTIVAPVDYSEIVITKKLA